MVIVLLLVYFIVVAICDLVQNVETINGLQHLEIFSET